MTLAELQPLLNLVVPFGLGVGITLLCKRYLPSYFSQKGKNLATREDIALITHEVERVRHDYRALLEELKARHQLRTAALDRRLQAHQEAFTYWLALARSHESREGAIRACESWWGANCVYLDPKVRAAFADAYLNAHLRAELLNMDGDPKEVTKAWDKVMAFPNVLFESIQLRSLTAAESQALKHFGESK